MEPWFPYQVLHICPHGTGLIDDHVEEIHQLILTAYRSAGIRIVVSATDGGRHTPTAHENVSKQYENFLPTHELDEISRHFVGKMEHWAVTDFVHAAKNFQSRILKYRLSEEAGLPSLAANGLQSILDAGSVLSDSTDLGAIKDEDPLSLFLLSSLFRIAETMGESCDDIPPNIPFAGYVLTGFTFLKLAVNSKQLSIESRKILLTLAFQQFKYEYLHHKLRQVRKRMKSSGVAIEPR
jgi:hypothetical protein